MKASELNLLLAELDLPSAPSLEDLLPDPHCWYTVGAIAERLERQRSYHRPDLVACLLLKHEHERLLHRRLDNLLRFSLPIVPPPPNHVL